MLTFYLRLLQSVLQLHFLTNIEQSGARGGGHDDNACGSYHRSCDCN